MAMICQAQAQSGGGEGARAASVSARSVARSEMRKWEAGFEGGAVVVDPMAKAESPFNPYAYWCLPVQRQRFPHMHMVARRAQLLPITNCESERGHADNADIARAKRNRLQADIIAALRLLKAHYREELDTQA